MLLFPNFMRTGLGVLHVLLCIYSKIHHVINSTGWCPALDEWNLMKSAYFTIHPGKNPLPQMVAGWNPIFFKYIKIKSTGFTSSTFPIQPDFSQNQPAAITLNTGSPPTLRPPYTWLFEGPFTLWTMKSDHVSWPFSMIRVHGPTFMVRLLKKLVLKALGPSLGVNWMWIKKNEHAPKNECANFFQYMFKKGSFEKNSSLTVLLFSLGLYLSFTSY